MVNKENHDIKRSMVNSSGSSRHNVSVAIRSKAILEKKMNYRAPPTAGQLGASLKRLSSEDPHQFYRTGMFNKVL